MPNHITNIIEIKETNDLSLNDIRACFINSRGHVDFNVITPLPDCLRDFEPSCGTIDIAKHMVKLASAVNDSTIKNFCSHHGRNFNDKEKSMVERAVANHKECGFCYWYDWQISNWGTKWNAYSQPEEGYPEETHIYMFQTAWSHPINLTVTLSQRLPDVLFSIKYADEDLGSNCGSYEIKNGEIISEDIAPSWSEQTKEQKRKYTEFAFSLCHPGVDPRSYGFDENFEYHEEIEEEWEQNN